MSPFPAPIPAELPPSARRLLDAQQDVVLSSQLTRLGVGADEVRRLVAQGALHRLRRGVLVDGAAWEATAPWERHAVRARAVGLEVRLGEKCLALSHHSALALDGISLYGVDDLVHLCTTDGRRGWRGSGAMVHGAVGEELTTTTASEPCCPGSCLQVRGWRRRRPGRCRRGRRDARGGGPPRPARHGHAELVVAHADGRRESAGESRTAWLCAELPLPELIPQAVITDELGEFVARVDFLVRGHRVIVEFDGLLKYDGRQQLVNEKRREDQLRRLGYEVVRLTWEDLDDPGKVLRMIRSAIERAHARGDRAVARLLSPASRRRWSQTRIWPASRQIWGGWDGGGGRRRAGRRWGRSGRRRRPTRRPGRTTFPRHDWPREDDTRRVGATSCI